MNKILSIVIPTYNMEKYLRRCLDSLIIEENKLFETLEVLVINDGSKDSSSDIAHEYQSNYPSVFRVIDKDNGNYGSCINRGLVEAKGKYVKILDADDYFDNSNFHKFLAFLAKSDVDMVISDYNVVNDFGKVVLLWSFAVKPFVDLQLQDCVCEVISKIQMHAITYKRQMLIDMDYYQTEGISYTDQEWSFLPLSQVKSIIYYNCSIYNYWVGRSGQTMEPSKMLASISHFETVAWRLLEFYEGQKWSSWLSNYYSYRLQTLISQIYLIKILYDHKERDSYLLYMDNKLFEASPYIHKLLEGVVYSNSFFPIHYIKLWRSHKIILLNGSVLVYKFLIRIQSFLRKNK